MAKSFFTIDEISQIVNGKGASLLPKKEVEEKEPLTDRDELLKMVFGGAILPSQTLQDSALQLDQALASNKALNGLRTATAVESLVGDAAVEAVGIAEESYNNTYGENALAKKISKKPIERLTEEKAFGSEGKKRILAALGIDEEDTREVEVEGGEIIENKDGTTQKVEGPKHEQGGVDAMIDDDATVYSDRLQSLIGASKVEKTAKSIAEEKEKRDAKALSLQKKLEKNPNDRLLANTLALTLQQNMIADQMDLMWQQVARTGLEEQAGGKERLMNAMFNKQDKTESEESEKQQEPQPEEEQQEPEANVEQEPQPEEEQQEQYAFGFDPNAVPFVEEYSEKKEDEKTKETQELLSSINNISGNKLTTESPEKTAEEKKKEEEEKTKRIQAIAGGVGNILGNQLYYTGAIISGLGGLNTTLQQRSEDILHENKYKGLARSVDKLYEQSISNISNVTNKRLQEMLNESQTTKQSIGNNFQSISNMAAYNAMLDDAVNKELAKIRGEELGAITGVQNERAKVLSANMQKEMEGQVVAEGLNDADRDAFYNALHLDYANIGTQMQAVASNMNKKYEDKTDLAKLLDEIKNIGNDNNSQGGGENTETNNKSSQENEKSKTDPVPTPPVITPPSPTQPEAPTVDANTTAKGSPSQQIVTEEVQSNKEKSNNKNPQDYEDFLQTFGIFKYLYKLEETKSDDNNTEEVTASTSSTQQETANAGTGTTSPLPAQTDVPSDEELKNLTYKEVSERFRNAVLNNLSDEAKLRLAQEMDKKEKEKRDAEQQNQTVDANMEGETSSQSTKTVITNGKILAKLLYPELSDLLEFPILNNLSDEAKLRLAQEMDKKEKEEKTQQKTNNKKDNSGIVTQQETQEHKSEVAPTIEANAIKANLIPQEKKNEQNEKDTKEQVDVTNEDIEQFTEDIEKIKNGKYKESYIPVRLEMHKIYMNSKINYQEEDISEEKKRQFTKTLSEARELMDKYNININSYRPTEKEEGEKNTDILLFNSSGDVKSTLEGTIDKKQSHEITQDELLSLIKDINTENDYFSEGMSYVTPSFANVDIYDKKRYPLSTLKAYRESHDFSDSEKKFLDELIARREFVDDAIEKGKIPVTENTLLKLDLARGAYMHWLNKNPTLQIDTNDILYLRYISKDFINEYEKNKNNLVFFNDNIKKDFNYAIDEIKNKYGSNDTKRKEFEEQMKKRNENIKIAEEQGKIIYEKQYPFYIDMYNINQVPIYLNAKENLIKLKKTITDIIDDYEKNKDKFYYPNDLGNNSEDGKESHYKEIMYLKNKMNQIEEKLKGFEQKEQTE